MPGGDPPFLSLFDDGGVFSLGSKNCPRIGEVTDLLLFFGRLGRGGKFPRCPSVFPTQSWRRKGSLFLTTTGGGSFCPLPFLYGARLRIVLEKVAEEEESLSLFDDVGVGFPSSPRSKGSGGGGGNGMTEGEVFFSLFVIRPLPPPVHRS